MTVKKRFIAVMSLTYIILMIILLVFLATVHDGHERSHKECGICLMIDRIADFFKSQDSLIYVSAAGTALFYVILSYAGKKKETGVLTPVLLKVQMNN